MEIKVNMREIRKILEEDFDINRLNSWKNDVSNSLEKIYNIELWNALYPDQDIMKFDKLYTLLNNIKFIQDREINNYDISNINEFAYDGCHKIYLIEDNVFVIYLYKKFTKESNVDYIEYITHNIEEIIDDFIKKYQ